MCEKYATFIHMSLFPHNYRMRKTLKWRHLLKPKVCEWMNEWKQKIESEIQVSVDSI